MGGFSNEIESFISITKETDVGGGSATLTFKSGSSSGLTIEQDAWLKIVLSDGTVYFIPAFSDDITP